MILLDFLFKICYAPLQSQEDKGKKAAIHAIGFSFHGIN
jgi:hypothetical protein